MSTITNETGTISNETGMITNETGMVTNETGLVTNETGMVTNETGLVTNETGLVTNVDIPQAEIIRYLGYKGQTPDDDTLLQIDECISEVQRCSSFKYVSRRFDLTFEGEDTTIAGPLTLKSKALRRNLLGCDEAIFIAATLGPEIDRLMTRYLRLSISKAAVLQATGAAAIEAYLDSLSDKIAVAVEKEGLFMRPRFSPGYGDLPLEIQGVFLDTLNATKQIGIHLSDGGVMLPEKSVTAIIGLSKEKLCHTKGCQACDNTGCEFRQI